jgi:hypothetical protein
VEKMKATYFVEGSEVSYSDCLDYFVMNSGFSRDDAVQVFNENNNPDCADYLTQECSDIEVIYQ